MKPTVCKGTLYVEVDGIEYELEWEGNLYPGKQGVYSGPPEKCYEDVPDEFELTKENWITKPHRALTNDEEDDIFNRAFEMALEEASDCYYGPEPDEQEKWW